MGDWQEVCRLYDQVLDLNLEAGDASELIPFFEGLVNLGKMRGHMRLRITVIAVYFS
jgi:hypothetical protein